MPEKAAQPESQTPTPTSPLHDTLTALGAEFAPVRGALLAQRFTSVAEECRAVREEVGVIARNDRGFLTVAGADAARWLQGMVTNRVQELQPGEGNYCCQLNAQGQIQAEFHLLALPDHFLLETDCSRVAPLRAALDKYIIADDVELADFSEKLSAVSVQGPKAGQLLTAAGVAPLPAQEHEHAWLELAGAPVLTVRLSDTGGEGFHLIFVTENAEPLWQALVSQQSMIPWKPVGYAALNTLRTEAGIPWWGTELTETTLPPEARLEENAISYDKGCYLGQEIIERIRSRGSVNRMLTGFFLENDSLPAPGAKLFKDDKQAGWLTTAVHSPALDRDIALGYLRREHSQPGTHLATDTDATAIVSPLPFIPASP